MTLGYIVPKGFPGLPEGWVSQTETVEAASGGLNLFVLRHEKAGLKPAEFKRVVVLVHGLGEHIGRYGHVPHYLKSHVDAIYGFDLRGHGRSGGTRGFVNRFEEYTEDLGPILKSVRNRYPSAELHLLAHSMGALVSLFFLKQNPTFSFQSCSLSSAFLDFKIEVPAVKKALAHALANVWGDLQLASGLQPSELSRDPALQEAWHQDMLIHRKATPKLYVEMKRVLPLVGSDENILTRPTLFLVPLADSIVSPEAELAFARRQRLAKQTGAVKVVEFQDGRHEGMNDLEKDRVFQEIGAWIQAHSKI